tara:strand:+ start:251 stop:667 length:417 start_codon:yes stop_codon:yes gene_type:complete
MNLVRSIKAGTLVAFHTGVTAPLFTVLPRLELDNDSLSWALGNEGWRLAESYNGTGYRVLVRPMGEPRWQERFKAMVVPVEVREVETGVQQYDEDTYLDAVLSVYFGPRIVAVMGKKIKASNPITRAENVESIRVKMA